MNSVIANSPGKALLTILKENTKKIPKGHDQATNKEKEMKTWSSSWNNQDCSPFFNF